MNELSSSSLEAATKHHPFCPEIDVRRVDCIHENGQPTLVFDLFMKGEVVRAFERVTQEGNLVPSEESSILGVNQRPLHPDDLPFVRELIDRKFFYNLQALQADFYNWKMWRSNPDW
ncbi:hypothetical protein HFO58_10940 [Rhizobium leguminosarum]|uniref:hypothetical protein n=1 Tax=Rhizobium leguminosarum TaxID=384 RepID=UPI001C97E25D|nr:hypothetical protein [Rhizobium leguminosarum]MBY5533673.1 hypothetical protein [Rhizobium leguminosarum]